MIGVLATLLTAAFFIPWAWRLLTAQSETATASHKIPL
jgi:hypothetical protein